MSVAEGGELPPPVWVQEVGSEHEEVADLFRCHPQLDEGPGLRPLPFEAEGVEPFHEGDEEVGGK